MLALTGCAQQLVTTIRPLVLLLLDFARRLLHWQHADSARFPLDGSRGNGRPAQCKIEITMSLCAALLAEPLPYFLPSNNRPCRATSWCQPLAQRCVPDIALVALIGSKPSFNRQDKSGLSLWSLGDLAVCVYGLHRCSVVSPWQAAL